MYRLDRGFLEVLLVHPGGPLWKSKDAGAWSIPKGEFLPGQDPLVRSADGYQPYFHSHSTD